MPPPVQEAAERVPPDYTVKPVHRAVRILKSVAASHAPLSLRRVSEMVGLPKSTVFRYLRTLTAEGLIVHDGERDLFAVDPAMLSLLPLNGQLALLRETALPHMKLLHHAVAGTIRLSVPSGAYVRSVDAVSSGMRADAWGARQLLHAPASGRSILAFLPADVRATILAPLSRDIAAGVETDAEVVRARGYAEETRGQLSITAVPIFWTGREPIGSLAAEIPLDGTGTILAEARTALFNAADAIGVSWRETALV